MFPGASISTSTQGQLPEVELPKIEKTEISDQDKRVSEIGQRKRRADEELTLSPKVLNPIDVENEIDAQRSIKKFKANTHKASVTSGKEQWDDSIERNFMSLTFSSSSSSSSSSISSSSTSITPSTVIPVSCLEPRPLYSSINAAIGNVQKPNGLLPDLVKLVVSYLKVSEYGRVFSEDEWETLCGRVDPAPALPSNIEKIWLGPCPVVPGKKVYETHMLIYIPTKVDAKPVTLLNLGEVAKQTSEYSFGYRYIWEPIRDELEDMSIKKPCWVLMTKDILPDSRQKNLDGLLSMVDKLKKVQADYEVPKVLEATVCILAQCILEQSLCASSKKVYLDECLFDGRGMAGTICQEVVSGSIVIAGRNNRRMPYGLVLERYKSSFDWVGVSAMRKF